MDSGMVLGSRTVGPRQRKNFEVRAEKLGEESGQRMGCFLRF